MISFATTRDEMDIINMIADRALAMYQSLRVHGISKHEIMMDVTACHANGCPLNLDDLLGADNGNFSHDIGGIRRHLNRETGKLEDCFVPRFARRGMGKHRPLLGRT